MEFISDTVRTYRAEGKFVKVDTLGSSTHVLVQRIGGVCIECLTLPVDAVDELIQALQAIKGVTKQ